MSDDPQASDAEPDLLLRWYLCYRKSPMTEEHAATKAQQFGANPFRCTVMPDHWHVGRVSGESVQNRRRRLRMSAKTRYKNDVSQGFLTWQGGKRPLPPGADPLYQKTTT